MDFLNRNKRKGSGKDAKDEKKKPAQNGDGEGNRGAEESGEKNKKKLPFSPQSPKQSFWTNLATTFLIFLVLIAAYSLVRDYTGGEEPVPISELAQQIENKEVKKLEVSGDNIMITYIDDTTRESKKETDAALTETLTNYGVSKEALSSVTINVTGPGALRIFMLNIAPFLLPLIIIGIIIWFLTRQVRGQGMQAFSFGQSRARIIDPADKSQRVKFKDIAGAKEAKEELREIVDFLKNPQKFINIGAQIPKGVLMMGPSGTGKTFLARAVAGEAGVPFFNISGSEFVEMFVGVGASRVRDLFKMAKKAAPAIIFIDEIDAVGRVRGTGVGGGNDEREQTLNQILVEMDGFEPTEKLIIIAATNRPDVLDPALLRPGRFDRRVTIDLPDRDDREAILKVHIKKKPMGEDVDMRVIAERTPGFSGADLANLMNEAAIVAARENRKTITQYDLIRSIEKVMLGPERRSRLLSKRERKITAYHEAGHALISSVLPYADPVHKISIIARGHAGGYTLKLPFEERRYHSRREFLDDICSSLGGYAAEKLVFGDVSTGPSNDLQVLTALARQMVTKYGMSETLGPVALEGEGGRALFGQGMHEREYSEKVSAEIDAEVRSIIGNAYEQAKEILTKYRGALDAIAEKLLETETLEREDFETVLREQGIAPKKKETDDNPPGQALAH